MLHKIQKKIPTINRDYVEWHRGRMEYGLWLIKLGTKEIYQSVDAAREHLSDFLLKPYQRQRHVSIFICGFCQRPCPLMTITALNSFMLRLNC